METRRFLDQPREADTTLDVPPQATVTPERRLAALSAHLKGRGLVADVTATRLVVRNPNDRALVDTITCRKRPDDGNRWWFFTGRNEPIAEADRITDAGVTIAGYLKHNGEAGEA